MQTSKLKGSGVKVYVALQTKKKSEAGIKGKRTDIY